MDIFGGFIGGLITAWVLTLFSVDKIIIQFTKEILSYNISVANQVLWKQGALV